MTDNAAVIARRKNEHIQINLHEDVQAKGVATGLARYRFVHAALPEMDFNAIDTRVNFLGHRLTVPLLLSCMTGGVKDGLKINRRLATVAQALGCAMGVGSQRAAIIDPGLERLYQVRDVAPDVLLLANLGAVQLNYGFGVDQCRRAVAMIGANALVLHLNPLQEAIQHDGNVDFSNLARRIASVCRALDVPVIVKEVGWGISAPVARLLLETGVAAIDVAGAGGTSWSEVEACRAPNALLRRVSSTFAGWGIPTADSLRMARAGAPNLPLIASGGLRTGLDAAKVIALGADLAGFGGPLLRAAAVSERDVHDLLLALITELRISMFCSGAKDIAELKCARLEDASSETR
jgi:isopentenyl-diphosphate delta-isomerase